MRGMVKNGLQILLVYDLDCKSKSADFLRKIIPSSTHTQYYPK